MIAEVLQRTLFFYLSFDPINIYGSSFSCGVGQLSGHTPKSVRE